MLTRQRSSGVHQHVANIRYQLPRSLLALMSSHLSHQCETWEFIYTQTCQCEYTFRRLCQLVFAVLRQIRSIRRSVTRPVLQSLVASMVLTRLDYGCSTLAGLPAWQLNRLQSVVNSAARLVYSAKVSFFVSSTGCASQSGSTSASPF